MRNTVVQLPRRRSLCQVMVLAVSCFILIAGCIKKNLGVSLVQTQCQPASTGVISEYPEQLLVTYYFHGTFRCPTCLKIERLAGEAITTFFSDEIKSGSLEFKIINMDEPDNTHYKNDFSLESQAFIVTFQSRGKLEKWKNLERIWELYDDEGAFLDYVHEEISSFKAELGFKPNSTR